MTSDLITPTAALNSPNAARLAVENQRHHQEWDDFVTRTPGGDLTQTSPWARLKRISGMQCHRVVLRVGGAIAGGAQLLLQRVGVVGTLAYIPYGPIIRPDLHAEAIAGLVRFLREECRRNRVRALCVQPPEGGEPMASALRGAGFCSSDIEVAPAASLRLDLRLDTNELVSQMSTHKRAEMRRSQRDPLSVRFGNRDDLESFQVLHNMSAAGKGFVPAPLTYLESLWDELGPTEQVVVLLASIEGMDVAGLLVTRFGDVATTRLRGFAPERLPKRMRPNEALTWAAIDWSRERGARWLDLGGIDRVDSQTFDREGSRGHGEHEKRLWHKVAMGGDLVVYPEPLELIPNALLRTCYAALRSNVRMRRFIDLIRVRARAAARTRKASR